MKIQQNKIFDFLAKNPSDEIDLESLVSYCTDNKLTLTDNISTNSSEVKEVNIIDKDRDYNVKVSKNDNFVKSSSFSPDEDITVKFDPSKLIAEDKKELFDLIHWESRLYNNNRYLRLYAGKSEYDEEYRKLIKQDKSFANQMRAKEIANLVMGKTKKPSINGKFNFEKLVDIINEISYKKNKEHNEISDTLDYFTVDSIDNIITDLLDSFKEKFDINKYEEENLFSEIQNLKIKLNKILQGKEEVTVLEFSNLKNNLRIKEKKYDKYRAYRGYVSYEDMFLDRLQIPEKLVKKLVNKEVYLTRDNIVRHTIFNYLKDYFNRLEKFVNDIWEEAVESGNVLDKNINKTEIKLLYAIIKGCLDKLEIHPDELNRMFGISKMKGDKKVLEYKYSQLLLALGLKIFISNYKDTKSKSTLVYNRIHELYIDRFSDDLKNVIVKRKFKLDFDCGNKLTKKSCYPTFEEDWHGKDYKTMYEILEDSLQCLKYVEDK